MNNTSQTPEKPVQRSYRGFSLRDFCKRFSISEAKAFEAIQKGELDFAVVSSGQRIRRVFLDFQIKEWCEKTGRSPYGAISLEEKCL